VAEKTTLGAGCVLVTDVESKNSVYIGVPAKERSK